MYRLNLVLLVSIFFVPLAWSDAQLNRSMRELAKNMQQIFPVIFTDHTKANKDEHQKLVVAVNGLISGVKGAKKHLSRGNATQVISYDVLLDHLNSIHNQLEKKQTQISRYMLKQTPSICISCHIQDGKQRGIFNSVSRNDFSSDYAYAEFNHMTRNYNRAIRYYDRFINSHLKDKGRPLLDDALRRKLAIMIQTDRVDEIQLELQNLSKGLKDNLILKNNLIDWIKGLKGLSKVKAGDWKQLESLAQKYITPFSGEGALAISEEKKIHYIQIAQLLRDYLHKNPSSPEIPKILYWLSVCDRLLNYNFAYSLADLYLKQCILKFSKHPYASKCYEEYKDYIVFSFTGSRGTEIPDDIRFELDNLKKKLKGL